MTTAQTHVPASSANAAQSEALSLVLQQLVAEHEGLLALAGQYRAALAQADVQAMEACLEQQSAALFRVQDLELRRQQVVRGFASNPTISNSPTAVAQSHHRGLSTSGISGTAGPTGSAGARLNAAQPLPSMSALSSRLVEPTRGRVLALAERLRDVLNRLHQEHAAIREAAETLGAHMEGVLRQVCRKISHAGTYGPRASIDTRTPVVTALDVRS